MSRFWALFTVASKSKTVNSACIGLGVVLVMNQCVLFSHSFVYKSTLTPVSETLPLDHRAPLKDNEVVQKRRRIQQMNTIMFEN